MAHGVLIDGRALELARLRQGLSRHALSRKCKAAGDRVDNANIARYEREELRPSAKTLLAMAQALGMDVADLAVIEEPTARVTEPAA